MRVLSWNLAQWHTAQGVSRHPTAQLAPCTCRRECRPWHTTRAQARAAKATRLQRCTKRPSTACPVASNTRGCRTPGPSPSKQHTYTGCWGAPNRGLQQHTKGRVTPIPRPKQCRNPQGVGQPQASPREGAVSSDPKHSTGGASHPECVVATPQRRLLRLCD